MGTRLTGEFDVQAHRGAAGLTSENTLEAFGRALAVGVTTLECDVHVSEDGVPVVTHDRRVSPLKNRDTAAALPGDPEFPYVDDLVARLDLGQISTLDAGSLAQPDHTGQHLAPGARMPTLAQVFDLLAARGASTVRVNVETKHHVTLPLETSPRRRFVEAVAACVRVAGLLDRVSVQSFDWRLLTMVRRHEPSLALNALTSGHYLEVGRPGASPWLGGLDIDDFHGDLVAAAAALGFDAVSPIHGSPFRAGVEDPAYRPFVTAELVERAHAAGMRVLPYTVDDPATMRVLLELGVDGLITNRPDLLRAVLAQAGLPLPARYPEGREPPAHHHNGR